MTDKEKKAIDYLQLCYDLSTIDNKSLPKLATLLNLIEKQQKEIENSVSKDKIRERIEELRMSGGSDGRDNTENLVRELVSEILEDLLEKGGKTYEYRSRRICKGGNKKESYFRTN